MVERPEVSNPAWKIFNKCTELTKGLEHAEVIVREYDNGSCTDDTITFFDTEGDIVDRERADAVKKKLVDAYCDIFLGCAVYIPLLYRFKHGQRSLELMIAGSWLHNLWRRIFLWMQECNTSYQGDPRAPTEEDPSEITWHAIRFHKTLAFFKDPTVTPKLEELSVQIKPCASFVDELLARDQNIRLYSQVKAALCADQGTAMADLPYDLGLKARAAEISALRNQAAELDKELRKSFRDFFGGKTATRYLRQVASTLTRKERRSPGAFHSFLSFIGGLWLHWCFPLKFYPLLFFATQSLESLEGFLF